MPRKSVSQRVQTVLASKTRKKGEHLTKADDELVYQTCLLLENKAAAARKLNVTERTLHRAIARVEARKTAAQLQEQRKAAAGALTSSIDEQTHKILDSISDDDLKSGRIEERNSKGEITGYKYFGPSLLQKATSVGILTDKLKVLREMERNVSDDLNSGALMMPETADQLLAAIKNRVDSIQVLQVNFRKENPDIATRIDQALEVEAAEVTSAGDVDERFPFD